jgi:16S rRNA (adenine1518-N6/adenine1519-N6)-dimethyltransferase
VDELTFVVQREVAERLRARPGTSEYGPISVTTQMLATVQIDRVLKPAVFHPPPKVDSALVQVRRDDRVGSSARDFARFVRKLFASRRKTIRKALSQMNFGDFQLGELGIDERVRAEMLAPEVIHDLFRKLSGLRA